MKRKMSEIGVDRISELPEEIIQYIVSFLPVLDVAKMSVLSKKWQQKRVWDLCSGVDFDETCFIEKLKNGSLTEDKKTEHGREKFINFVDAAMRKFCENKLDMKKFKLCMTLEILEHASLACEWLGLAIKNQLEELKLKVMGSILWFRLPQEIFGCKSITVFKLRGCVLELPLSERTVKFHSLQKLSLDQVFVNEHTVNNLFKSCPSIVQLSFKLCRGLEFLSVSGLPKLKKLKFIGAMQLGVLKTVRRVYIGAPSLQNLTIGGNNVTKFNVDANDELKILTLKDGNIVRDRMFHDLLSKFPCLETLDLNCSFLRRVNIYSNSLNLLKINKSNMIMVGSNIHTPKLRSFEYGGNRIPFFSLNAPCPWNIQLHLETEILLRADDNIAVNGAWYLKLKEFLSQATKIEALTLSCPSVESSFALEKMEDISSYVELAHLSLGITTSTSSYAAFLDGLFWSFHPKTVSIASGCESANNFIEFLCENLMYGKDHNCCTGSCIICWKHFLKDVKIESIERAKENNPHKWITHLGFGKIPEVLLQERPVQWNTLLNALPTFGGAHIHFSLDWKSHV